jgi:TolA-binding protein
LPLKSFGLRLGFTLGLFGVPLGTSPALAAAERVDTRVGQDGNNDHGNGAGQATRTRIRRAPGTRTAAAAVEPTSPPLPPPAPGGTLGSPPASEPAHPPDPNTQRILAEARVHFEAGTDQYAAGRYEDAIRSFQAGYALVPRPNFLVNIGQAYRKLGNLVRAKEAYVAYVRALPEKSALRDQALQVLAEIEVQLQDQAGGTRPGSAITGLHPEEPPASAASFPTPSPAAPPHSRLAPWLGLGVGGAGLALVATGVGFQMRAKAASDRLADASRREEPFDPAEQQAGKRAEKIGNGLFAAGGAVMAAGLLLFLVIDAASGPSTARADGPRLALDPQQVMLKWTF